MRTRLLLALPIVFLCGCSSSPVETPDAGPVALTSLTTPPLAQAFPLAPQNDGMRVAFRVLVNENTIVTPTAVLRFVYTKPASDGAGRVPHKSTTEQEADDQAMASQVRHHRGGAGDGTTTSSGGFPNGMVTPLPDDPNAAAAAKNGKGDYAGQEMDGTVWVDQFLYTEALANAVEGRTMIVYSVPPDPKPVSAPLRLIGGMLLGETGGKVAVLGLGETSPAFLAGVRAGDTIATVEGMAPAQSPAGFVGTVDGQVPVSSLAGFVSAYTKARALATARGTGSPVTIDVRTQKGGQPIIPVEIVPGN